MPRILCVTGLLFAAAMLGPALSTPAAGAATSAQEGVAYTFTGGDSFTWRPPAGTYLLVPHGEPDADLDLRDIKPVGGRTSEQLNSTRPWFGAAVEFNGAESKTLRIASGTGGVLLARNDMTVRPLTNLTENIHAEGTISRGACRAYLIDTWQMFEPYRVEAAGNGFQFQVLEMDLDPIEPITSRLNVTLDPSDGRAMQVLVQACRQDPGPGSFRTWVTYPATLPGAEGSTSAVAWPLVAGVVGLLGLIGGGTAFVIMKRREKRRRGH